LSIVEGVVEEERKPERADPPFSDSTAIGLSVVIEPSSVAGELGLAQASDPTDAVVVCVPSDLKRYSPGSWSFPSRARAERPPGVERRTGVEPLTASPNPGVCGARRVEDPTPLDKDSTKTGTGDTQLRFSKLTVLSLRWTDALPGPPSTTRLPLQEHGLDRGGVCVLDLAPVAPPLWPAAPGTAARPQS
jgi:hypothetical protein